MALATFKPASHAFELGDSSVTVTGLSLNHIASLLRAHIDDIEALFELFSNLERTHSGDVLTFVTQLITEAPGFVANVIALAAGEPDSAQQAQLIPAPLQIQILLTVFDLTFKDVGGPKKAMEMITTLLTNMPKGQAILSKAQNIL